MGNSPKHITDDLRGDGARTAQSLEIWRLNKALSRRILKRFFEPEIFSSYLQSVDEVDGVSTEVTKPSNEDYPELEDAEDLTRLEADLFDVVPEEYFDEIDEEVSAPLVNIISGTVVLPTAPLLLGYKAGLAGLGVGVVFSLFSLGLISSSYRSILVIIERTPTRVEQ